MDLTEKFQKYTTKFLFLNCKDDANKSTDGELNNLLNDLNSLDYEKSKLVDHKAAVRLVESFINIPISEEIIIIKSCSLLKALLSKQKIELPSKQFDVILNWIIDCLKYDAGKIEFLSTMQVMFKNHPQHCKKFWNQLLIADGLLVNLLNESSISNVKDPDGNSYEDIVPSVIICIESLLLGGNESDCADEEMMSVIGLKIINIIYSNKIKTLNCLHNIVAMTSAINILHKISVQNLDWCESHLGELIGISKAYMHYGLLNMNEIIPQKVMSSQQSVFEASSVPSDTNKGGKVAKTRKPRTVNKNRKNENNGKNYMNNFGHPDDHDQFLNRAFEIENSCSALFNKTSDSDFSESEAGRAQNAKQKKSKLRLTSIALIGVIAKTIEKKKFYGYWHSLLTFDKLDRSHVSLLNTILYDSNARCRIQALQVTCLMLYGSKAFLFQAENSEKSPTAYMPFSISLGNMIVGIYESLTQGISTENSLPVLTQILKCLTVLIHNTPFTRLKSGFITRFVQYIRKLIYHKDHTIQVAALMVMEFLIASQEFTTEISECVGIPKGKFNTSKLNENKLNDFGVEEVIEIEFYDEEIEENEENVELKCDDSELKVNDVSEISETVKMSWLLQKVLENLGVILGHLKVKSMGSSISVRIESLNVLTSMASHLLIFKSHLELIGMALKNSLLEDQQEIRSNCGKCLDAFGHAINTFLLENPNNDDILLCQSFWSTILPYVIEKIQDSNQNPTLRSYLCDFLSNIGVHIFERYSHAQQMQLISLLSGISCNDENTVRASAVRALAIYVFFPSLREDLCFVENTAESILKLSSDTNSYVRIKASWSMANISDVLTTNCTDFQHERISDDLLERLLKATIESTNDSHKVKSNAVRAIGSLLRLINDDHLKNSKWREICLKGIEKLIFCMNSGSNAKVKWNSCYAIGNMMKNKALFMNDFSDMDWQKLVFPSICNVIITANNFKVRTNGAASLIIVNDRNFYGIYFVKIWKSILLAVEQSDNLIDFNEYKHRDNLQEQLCLCLSHIIKIATKDDLIVMCKEFTNYEEVNKIWCRVTNRVIPENVGPIIDCWIHLQKLIETDSTLTSEQKNSVEFLTSHLPSTIF